MIVLLLVIVALQIYFPLLWHVFLFSLLRIYLVSLYHVFLIMKKNFNFKTDIFHQSSLIINHYFSY